MKQNLSIITIVLSGILFLTGCSSTTNNRSLNENFSAFLNENPSIISFGLTKVNSILDKTNYQSESKIKAFLNEPLSQLKSSVNLDQVYYAIEGPIVNENPKAVYLFLEVKNSDSLKANLTENGFTVNKTKSFNYVGDGDMHLAFDEKLVTVLIQADVQDEQKALLAIREKLNNDLSEGSTAEIINRSDDIVFGVNLENLYKTSSTDLAALPKDKQAKLESMLKDAFVESGLSFKDGAIVYEVENHFNQELKNTLFLNKDSKAQILNKLGKGHPMAGLSLNLDPKKLQSFLDEFAPNAMRDLSDNVGGTFSMAMTLANNDISKLIDGRVGLLAFGDSSTFSTGVIPEVNFFVGLAGHGKTFGESIKELIASSFEVVKLTDNGISGFTSTKYDGQSINLSKSLEKFGKNSFNLFIDFSQVDFKQIDLEGEAEFLELINYVSIDYGIEGGKLLIKAKNGKENALEQVFQKALKLFEDELVM